MYSYHYFEGAEGRRFCYAARPTERCPFEDGPPPWLAGPLSTSVAHADVDVALAGRRGIIDVELVWRNAHRGTRHKEGRCGGCGARLERLGFAAWIEEPWPDEDAVAEEARKRAREASGDEEEAASHARTTRAINTRMGNTHRIRPGSHRHLGLRREAMAWALEESRIDKASAVPA